MRTSSISDSEPLGDGLALVNRLAEIRPRLHAYVPHALFPSVCAYAYGYADAIQCGALINAFRLWLIDRTGGQSNWGIESCILLLVPAAPDDFARLTREQHDAANAAFFELFDEFTADGVREQRRLPPQRQ